MSAEPDPVEVALTALRGWTIERADGSTGYRSGSADLLRISAPISGLGRRLFAVLASLLTVAVGVAISATWYLPFMLLGVPAAIVGVVGVVRSAREVVAPRVPFVLAVSRERTDVTDARGSRRTPALERVVVVLRRVSGGVTEATVTGIVAREEVLAIGPIDPLEARALASVVAGHLGLVGGDDDRHTLARQAA